MLDNTQGHSKGLQKHLLKNASDKKLVTFSTGEGGLTFPSESMDSLQSE